MSQPMDASSQLVHALIAHDPCAAVVLDADARIVAWNADAGVAFGLDAVAPRGRRVEECTSPRCSTLIGGTLDELRRRDDRRPRRLPTPEGVIAITPLRADDRLLGFVVRRETAAPAAGELDVVRAELQAARAANDDLRRRLEELEGAAAADRHKDEFLAMLAHELRMPLAPILSAMQILRRQATENPMVQRAREVVERQALHQARLLDDLLDVSRITRGKIELRRRPVSVGAAVTAALEATRSLIQAKAQSLTVALPEEPAFVDADPTRLTQIITNLLNNAAKYTHAGGRIGISLERAGEQAVVIVRDNGVGIPREMLALVFDLFAQAEPATARSQGGLGIGLTLVKNLVEMHGGTVVARSQGRGQGSEFEVRLPAVAAPRTEAAPAPAGVPTRTFRVLLVEDHADTRETLRRVLELDGHQVQEAADGLRGIELALGSRPEIIIIDIGLPGLDGFEVARRLRAALGEGPLLIALTGYGQAEDLRLSRAAGFDVHLVKPVSPEQLAAALESRRSGEAA
jgi:signal transduction histidine kinase